MTYCQTRRISYVTLVRDVKSGKLLSFCNDLHHDSLEEIDPHTMESDAITHSWTLLTLIVKSLGPLTIVIQPTWTTNIL